nr:unnamed protein product [Spirometra erinaceieuropaei]
MDNFEGGQSRVGDVIVIIHLGYTNFTNSDANSGGKKNEVLLEAGEADSPYAAILEDVAGINFRALVDQWNKNGLMETDIDAVSNRVPTGLGTTPTPNSSMSFSLSDSSRTEAETSDIQTAAVYTRLCSTPTPTSSVSISVDEASTTDSETSEIHSAAGLRTTPNPTPTMSISLGEASNTETGASAIRTSAGTSNCNTADRPSGAVIPQTLGRPSSRNRGADKYAVHTFEVIHFVPANRLSITKDPNYENATRLSSITPPIEGRDLVKEQIGKAYKFIKDTAL